MKNGRFRSFGYYSKLSNRWVVNRHPPARECADLCGIKKESVKCAFVRTKKGGVRSLFTRSRAPAYRVHKLAFGTKMHTKKGRMQQWNRNRQKMTSRPQTQPLPLWQPPGIPLLWASCGKSTRVLFGGSCGSGSRRTSLLLTMRACPLRIWYRKGILRLTMLPSTTAQNRAISQRI